MRDLDLLLRDYEVQMDAQRQRDYELDALEVRRAEQAKIGLADRLAAQIGKTMTLQGVNAETWSGELKGLGLGWVHLVSDARQLIIPVHSILWWEGGDAKSYTSATDVSRKLTLGYVLRALAGAQRGLTIEHVGIAGMRTEGRVYAVGADYVDLIQYKTVASSGRTVPEVRTLPFSSIAVIRVS